MSIRERELASRADGADVAPSETQRGERAPATSVQQTRDETVHGPEKRADHRHELDVAGGRAAADVKRHEASEAQRPAEHGEREAARPERDRIDEQAERGAAEAQAVRDASVRKSLAVATASIASSGTATTKLGADMVLCLL